MASGRGTSVRTRFGAMLMLVGLITGTFSVFGPRAEAVPIAPGSTIGDFEIDANANFAVDAEGKTDWEGLDLAQFLHFDDNLQDPDPDGTGDEGYIGGAKEFDRSTWGCADDAGKTPQKDNIFYTLAYPSLSLAEADVAFAYVRDRGTGDTNVSIELNQASLNACSKVNDRTVGDLLLHFNFPGGTDAAQIDAYVWDGAAFDVFDLPANVAAASTNQVPNQTPDLEPPAEIQDELTAAGAPIPIGDRQFGEAAIDLFALQEALQNDPDIGDQVDQDVLSCPGVGYANIRTRSSESGDTSQLHDVFPQMPIDLSNCASLKLKKVDDLGQPMAGVQFGLFATEAAAVAGTPIAQLPTTPPQNLVCTTDASGVCTFPKVPAGDYYVNELNLPASYSADPDLPKAVHLDAFQDLDLSDDDNGACASDVNAASCEWFVNTLRTGSVEITKAVVDGEGEPLTLTDITYLDGITFDLQDQTTHATIQKRAGGDATCTLDLDDAGDEPSCTISGVAYGTYDVVEDTTTLPAGLSAGPSVPVTIDGDPVTAEVTYENPADPLNISIDKTGNTNSANVGDTITYTFTVGLGALPFDTVDDVDLQPLTSVAVSEVVLAPDYANRCTASALALTDKEDVGPMGDDWLEEGERWTYQCTHVVAAAEAFDSDGTALKNRAHVTGTDRYGRTAQDEDDHLVTILLPDLQVVKQAADGVDEGTAASSNETIDAPGTASYSIVVTNVGAGIARNATLTDTLPAGSWTVSLASPDGNDVCPVGGNPKTGSFSCTFGDLAPNASKTVTVSRSVTIAADCAAVLTNNAGVTTTYQTVDIDPVSSNDSSSATINVRCPDVGVVKSATTTPISAGQRAEWSITVTNHGAGVANDVFLVDTVPAGLTSLQLGGTDAASCSLTGHSLVCDFGDLAGAAVRTVTVSGLTDAADCATIPNTASVASTSQGASYLDTNPTNNSSTANVVVQCPDVYVEKTGPAEVSAGDTITWDITFGNNGPGDAINALLTDNLPAGLTGYQLTDPDEVCSLAATTVTCSFALLEAGAEHTISVTGTTGTSSSACGDVVNPASISADNEATGTVRDNNLDSATTDVECPDVDLLKEAYDPAAEDEVASPFSVAAGDPVGFTITVSNASGEDVGTARAVTISDTLPDIDGYTWTIAAVDSDESSPCALDGLELSCAFGDLSPGEQASVTLVATLDEGATPELACGTYLNTAHGSLSNGSEADETNNSATVVILCPGVNLAKVADAPIVEAGDQIGFTITVTNLDDGVPPAEGLAQDVVVDDDLPGDLGWEIADDSDLPDGAICEISGGSLHCTLGDLPAVRGAESIPQVTIHLVADTTPADCATYDNTATATVANGVDPDDADASSRVRCPISIDLDKTGDTIAHLGDVVDYDFTVTNDGGEDLLEVVLSDVECDAGTIVLVDDGDGDAVLAAGTWDPETKAFVDGEVWSYTCERTLTAEDVVLVNGQDLALNTGSVRGEDSDGREATDTDPHQVEIITPVIEVVKTVDDDTPDIGQTVTFTYVVTNTGDTTLFDVSVSDDQLGAIGTIAELAPGASSVLTKAMVVAADSPTRNVATATGADVLGKSVTDDDDATITVVLGEVITRPQVLPRTGADADEMLLFAGLLLVLGGLLVASGEDWKLQVARRRRR